MNFILSILALVSLGVVLTSAVTLPLKVGEIKLKYAAFLQVFESSSANSLDPDRFTLLISTFAPYNFQRDPKYYVKGPGKYLNNLTAFNEAISVLDTNAFWPNDPDYIEANVFGYDAFAWPSGFLVPGKTAGQLEVYKLDDLTNTTGVNIASKDEEDWWYHRSIWLDVNKDGHVDAVTARFKFPSSLNPATGELVWFENPGGPLRPGWNQHVLVVNGPDVHFRHLSISNSENKTFDCILAAEFWNEQLNLYCVEEGPASSWSNSTLLKIPVDPQSGQPFDCLVGDLNNDGREDLISTTYFEDQDEGFVFAYEVPTTFPYGDFKKHTIASGFRASKLIAGDSMSPGSAKLFHPHVSQALNKSSVMLSGDDDGCHYILTPLSEDTNDWGYQKDLLVNTTMTTSGKFAVEDLDGDGWTEIIAAGYSSDTLYIYTYKPEGYSK